MCHFPFHSIAVALPKRLFYSCKKLRLKGSDAMAVLFGVRSTGSSCSSKKTFSAEKLEQEGYM